MTTPDRIQITSETALREKLSRKLQEYRRRLEFQAPEVEPHETYKLRVLSALFERGNVDIGALRLREQENDWFDGDAFDNAVRVIAAYNANELGQLTGGTGLR